MREQPWNLRKINSDQERWYQNILELQFLTEAWLGLPHVVPSHLEARLENDFAEEFLTDLEKKTWMTHALTLSAQIKNLKSLKQISWDAGNSCAQKRWSKFPQELKKDLRGMLAALRDSPFSEFPHRESFLLVRSLAHQVDLELKSCPHENLYPEIQRVSNELCELHSCWMHGFLQHLNPKIKLEYIQRSFSHAHRPVRCVQKWCFAQTV
jgi:hypothetical protein